MLTAIFSLVMLVALFLIAIALRYGIGYLVGLTMCWMFSISHFALTDQIPIPVLFGIIAVVLGFFTGNSSSD